MYIYIMPTEEGLPPRAVLAMAMRQEEDGVYATLPLAVQYIDGTWFAEDMPLPDEIGSVITERAEELGVEL